jgi:hypothetical protein
MSRCRSRLWPERDGSPSRRVFLGRIAGSYPRCPNFPTSPIGIALEETQGCTHHLACRLIAAGSYLAVDKVAERLGQRDIQCMFRGHVLPDVRLASPWHLLPSTPLTSAASSSAERQPSQARNARGDEGFCFCRDEFNEEQGFRRMSPWLEATNSRHRTRAAGRRRIASGAARNLAPRSKCNLTIGPSLKRKPRRGGRHGCWRRLSALHSPKGSFRSGQLPAVRLRALLSRLPGAVHFLKADITLAGWAGGKSGQYDQRIPRAATEHQTTDLRL